MEHLLRRVAPLADSGWQAIEEEAAQRLRTQLAGRKIADFHGPKGWRYSATDTGRVEPADAIGDRVRTRRRVVLPLIELRVPFTINRSELEAVSRGAEDPDLGDLDEAVAALADAENRIVFHGGAGMAGLTQASSHEPITLPPDYDHYPGAVAKAVNMLRLAGIGGAYALAIGPDGYTGIAETTEDKAFPLLEHLQRILGGPVIWAPGVKGAVVASLRGGDFVIDSGQDISIGYLEHQAETVQLYLEESFSFRVIEPDAAVALLLP